MKRFNNFLPGSLLLFATLIIFGCTKHVEEPTLDDVQQAKGATSAQAMMATACKPSLFGVYTETSQGGSWTTIAQRWYENGKIRYFKGTFSGASPGYGGYIGVEPYFNIGWGEVTYEGNQVYLRDVTKNNRLVLRVTLDAQGRPEASYFHNQTDNYAFITDTTYYYYSGERLDYIVRLADILLYGFNIVHVWDKFTFNYDTYGNSTGATDAFGIIKLNIIYDYTKPVTGITSNYILTTSFRLMEFMELLKLPMHHAVAEMNIVQNNSMILQDKFADYVITDGRVQSYKNLSFLTIKQTFYNSWDCGTPP